MVSLNVRGRPLGQPHIFALAGAGLFLLGPSVDRSDRSAATGHNRTTPPDGRWAERCLYSPRGVWLSFGAAARRDEQLLRQIHSLRIEIASDSKAVTGCRLLDGLTNPLRKVEERLPRVETVCPNPALTVTSVAGMSEFICPCPQTHISTSPSAPVPSSICRGQQWSRAPSEQIKKPATTTL